MKNFELKGIWWLPENKDNPLNGILKFNELSYRYTNLDEWSWMNEFKINKQEPYELTMSYKLPTKISADINAGYVMENYPKAEEPALSTVQKNQDYSKNVC